MRKDGGLFICTSLEGNIEETPTQTCSHCNKIIMIKPGTAIDDLGGMCYGCMKVVCPRCVDQRVCRPIEKWMDQQEASYHARRSYEF